MLNVMRDNLRHLKPILWIVAASLVFYLGAYFSCDNTPPGADAPWAAKVGDATISTPSFLRWARQRDASYRQVLGEQYEQLRPQLRIGSQSIQALIDRQVILLEAEKLGLGASPAEIQRRILLDPSLKGPDGEFVGKETYVRYAERGWEGGVAGYERYLGETIVIEKWMDLISASVNVGDDELLELYRAEADRTELDYAVVASADQDVETDVTDADTQAWYDSHREEYRRDEGRELSFVVFRRQDMMAKVEVADADLRAYYDENTQEFTRQEERRARHILIRTEPGATEQQLEEARAAAENLHGRAVAGESFEDLARLNSDDQLSAQRGGDLGFFGRGAMVPEFERAVFETPVGEIAPMTKSSFGFHVIEVTDERAAGTAPFDEVRESIRERLRRQRAETMAEEEARRIYADAASTDALGAIAEAEGLSAESGTVRGSEPVPGLDAAASTIRDLFELEIGTVAEPVAVREGWAVVGVTAEVPSDTAPLAEVLAEVKTAILNDRLRKAARETASRAFERHGTVEKTATALGLEVLKSGSVVAGQILPRTGGMPAELREALFGEGAEVGASGVSPVPAGALLYEITARERFDPAEFAANKDRLREDVLSRRRNELVQTVVGELREAYDIRTNDALIVEYDT